MPSEIVVFDWVGGDAVGATEVQQEEGALEGNKLELTGGATDREAA